MTQSQRRRYLIEQLLAETGYRALLFENDLKERKLLRALLNVRPPKCANVEFLHVQDEYLQEELKLKGITNFEDFDTAAPDIYLIKCDITTLKCDGIVNAANSKMLGCFCPNHDCIDNAIHTFAGVQLRSECAEMMQKQGYDEPIGQAKITNAYNLPCKYVLHTVGPIVCENRLTKAQEKQLASCYRSCLALADEHCLESISFCCISTGEFGFPNRRAAEIAIQTVNEYKLKTQSKIKIIFNVYKEIDYAIYSELLATCKQNKMRA